MSNNDITMPAGEAVKADKKKKQKAIKKLHVEIPRGLWKRLEARIEDYNDDPERRTPKIGVAHIVNEALAAMLMKKER